MRRFIWRVPVALIPLRFDKIGIVYERVALREEWGEKKKGR